MFSEIIKFGEQSLQVALCTERVNQAARKIFGNDGANLQNTSATRAAYTKLKSL